MRSFVQKRRPDVLELPGQVYGPPCSEAAGGKLGSTCNIMERYSIVGYGAENARVMLVGIAPGGQEEIWGVPLVGPSGERNDRCLRAVKYPRERVYATNLICWRNDAPSQEEILACWPRLRAEIETVRPRLIVALGALACEWLTGYPLGKVRGDLIRPEYNRSPHVGELFGDLGSGARLPTVLPTWHPAASLRVGSLATDILRDYAKIKRFLRGELEPLRWGYKVIVDPAEAQRVLDYLDDRDVAIDVETERDVSDSFGKIVCVAVAAEMGEEDKEISGEDYEAYVFPIDVLRGLRWPEKTRWLAHNMQFDVPALFREYGVWLPNVHDTMLMSWGCDERPGRDEDGGGDRQRSGEAKKPIGPGYHGLKQLSAEYNGSPPGYGDEMKKSFGKTLEEIAAPKEIPIPEEELGAQETTAAAMEIPPNERAQLEELSLAGRKASSKRTSATKTEKGINAQETALAVDVLAGCDRESLGRNSGHPAEDGSDTGLSSELSPPAPKPKRSKSRKPQIPMRMETAAEAQDRFAGFLEKLYRYNAFDAVNTVALPTRLPVSRLCPAYETVITPAAQTYARMHLQGVPVDLERVYELQEDWTPWIDDLEAELQEEAYDYGYRNPPKLKRDQIAKAAWEAEHGEGSWMGEPLNLRSSPQLAHFLYGTLGLPVKTRTKKGNKPSTGAEAIAQMDHPFIDRMEEVRTAKHVKASHLDPIPELVKGDGRLHANIWVNGAVNYRRAITNPPLQQYPQEHPKPFWKRLAEVRSIIRPDPGYGLLEADYRQIELWGAALLSGDPVFLEELQSGDIHTANVRNVFKVDADAKSVLFSHTRRIAKVFIFAVIYRVEENTLAKIMNEGSAPGQPKVTPAQAGRLIRQWYARHRVFWEWQQQLIEQVKRYGRLENPFGEVRRFPLYDPMLDKQIVNFPVSSTCGAHSELSAVELEPILREHMDSQILFDTHDSLLVQVPHGHRSKVARKIQEVMERPKVPGWPPLRIEFKYSNQSWREMKTWEPKPAPATVASLSSAHKERIDPPPTTRTNREELVPA